MCTLCPPRHRRKVVRFDSFVDTISYSEYSQYASSGCAGGSEGGSGFTNSSSVSSFYCYNNGADRVVVTTPCKVGTTFTLNRKFSTISWYPILVFYITHLILHYSKRFHNNLEIVDSAAEALRLNVEEQAFKAAEFAGVRVFLSGLDASFAEPSLVFTGGVSERHCARPSRVVIKGNQHFIKFAAVLSCSLGK